MIAMIGEQNILLQYDAYHALMNEEDPMEGLRANLDVIAHIQIAGYPGRAEPIAEGCYDMGAFIELADTLGYTGAIGCEYNPANGTLAGLHVTSLLPQPISHAGFSLSGHYARDLAVVPPVVCGIRSLPDIPGLGIAPHFA